MVGGYLICFLLEDQSDDRLQKSIECIRGRGLHFDPKRLDNPDASPENIIEYEIISDNNNIARFIYDEYATVTYWLAPEDSSDSTEPDLVLSMEFDGTAGFDDEVAAIQSRLDDFVDLIADVVPVVDPTFVWAIPPRDQQAVERYQPSGRPIIDHIDGLSWLSVLSPSMAEDLGGRDRVLNAPAARLEDLETGHVLVVKTDGLVQEIHERDEIDRYLLDGAEVDNSDRNDEEGCAARNDGEPTFDDPFRAFETGDIGADIVVEKEAVGGELSNDVLQLRQVRLDEQRHLRDVETGEFVRRLYGPAGQIGSLPSEVTSEEELFPPLALNGVPVEFVRLSDSSDENVLTKCMALDVDLDKFELLVRLSSSVLDGGYTTDDIESVENILDSIGTLEDTDGIEGLIRDRLL